MPSRIRPYGQVRLTAVRDRSIIRRGQDGTFTAEED